jgi:L-asparaginase/Glu-tRNA(Gln) amidotransferase subunit D
MSSKFSIVAQELLSKMQEMHWQDLKHLFREKFKNSSDGSIIAHG